MTSILRKHILGIAGAMAVAIGVTGSALAAPVVTNLNPGLAGIPLAWAAAVATGGTVDLPTGASWQVNAAIQSGNVGGVYRSVFDNRDALEVATLGDNSLFANLQYFAVGPSNLPNPAVLVFTGVQQSLRLLWGSPDDYNSLQFWLNGAQVGSVSSGDIIPGTAIAARGASWVFITGVNFDELRFGATSNAFEFSNIRTTPIPLPAAAWLIFAGIGGLGLVSRRRRSIDA